MIGMSPLRQDKTIRDKQTIEVEHEVGDATTHVAAAEHEPKADETRYNFACLKDNTQTGVDIQRA